MVFVPKNLVPNCYHSDFFFISLFMKLFIRKGHYSKDFYAKGLIQNFGIWNSKNLWNNDSSCNIGEKGFVFGGNFLQILIRTWTNPGTNQGHEETHGGREP